MKVSVVTPSFNQARFIERTILSVLSQDWPSIEYVVFDGGSSDGTVDILKKYGHQLRWVSQKDDGQADAVNQGIAATSGEVIGWLNSDDIYYPHAVRSAAEYLTSHPEIDVVYGMADHIDVNDRPFESYWTEPWNLDRIQWHCLVCQPATFFRRSVVDRYGLLDAKLMYCMDYEYWLRLGCAGARFGYLEKKLAGSRMYADNKTQAGGVKVFNEINNMFRARFGHVPTRWIMNYSHRAVASRIDPQVSPLRFKLEVQVQRVLAQLRWNRKLSGDFLYLCNSYLRRRADRISEKITGYAGLLPDESEEPSDERGGIRLSGIYKDGWARPSLRIDHPAGNAARSINIILYAPKWLRSACFNLVARDGEGRFLAEYPFRRGQTVLVHFPLRDTAGIVKVDLEPRFRLSDPGNVSQTQGTRDVTVVVKHLEIRDPIATIVVFDAKAGDLSPPEPSKNR